MISLGYKFCQLGFKGLANSSEAVTQVFDDLLCKDLASTFRNDDQIYIRVLQ